MIGPPLRRIAIEGSAGLGLFRLLRMGRTGRVAVLNYHGFHEEPAPTGPYRYLFRNSLAIDRFEAHLRFLHQSMDLLTPDDFLAVARGAPPPRRGVLVTMDDGCRSQIDLAVPRLRHHRVGAVLLVPSGGISEASRGGSWAQWHERLAAVVLTDEPAVRRAWSSVADRLPGIGAAPAGSEALCVHLQRFGIGLPPSGQAAIESVIRSIVGREPAVDPLRYGAGPGTVLEVGTWEMLRGARAGGAEIGAHTVWHTHLASLPAGRLEEEITASAAEVGDRMGAACRFFSVPYGQPADSHPEQERIFRAAGIEVAFTHDAAPWSPPVPAHRTPRISLPADCSTARFEYYLSGLRPALAAAR